MMAHLIVPVSLWLVVSLVTVQAAEDRLSFWEDKMSSASIATDVRLRYESVDDDAVELDAHAVTLRLRTSLEVPVHRQLWLLTEFEGIVAPVQSYADGIESETRRPLIADAQTAELNRFQLRTDVLPKTQIVAGRQRLVLDDERFIGPVNFRQNDQTFDAVRIVTNPFGALVVEMAYIWQVNRIFGRRSDIGRFQGNSAYLHVSAPSPIGQVSAFHYALDLETGPEGERINTASSRTSGIRIAGTRRGEEFGVGWEASYAYQEDFADNPVEGSADYILGGVSLFWGDLSTNLRYEILGAGEQGFQAPLGTLHAFQGDADQFLVTPEGGVRDLSVQTGWAMGDLGPLRSLQGQVRYHHFRGDDRATMLGQEINMGLRGTLAGTAVSLAYAGYRAEAFASDQNRLWFTLERRF